MVPYQGYAYDHLLCPYLRQKHERLFNIHAKRVPVWILLDDLIYADLNGFILEAAVASIFVYAEFSCGHCLSMRDLSKVKAKLFVVPSLVGEVPVPFNCEKKS